MEDLILLLLDDGDGFEIINRPILRYVVEDLQNPLQLPYNYHIGERTVRQKNQNYYEEIVPLYNHVLFKEHFRMGAAAVDELENIIGNAMIRNQNSPVALRKKILYTIWLLAKQESYLAVGDRFGIAKSTGHGILKEIVDILIELMPRYIMWPNREMCNISSTIFRERSHGFPGVIGAIDGSHIPCKAPPHNANDYYNRNSYHSMILQGTCDYKARFINIFVGLPGRMHDAQVFRRSGIYAQLTNAETPLLPKHQHLIGDAAYPLLCNLMTPFRDTGHLTRSQILYNVRLSSIRSIVERGFGLLKVKFRRLNFLDISDFELGPKMIAAACVLHNFIIERGEINFEDEREINEIIMENDDDLHDINGRNTPALEKRNEIMRLL